MSKPTLLFASPFLPKQSGISEYSAALLNTLSRYFAITLYIDDYDISDPRAVGFSVIRHGRGSVAFHEFDYRIYQIGNSPFYHSYIYKACLRAPGLVVLHEPVLYYLTAGVYRDSEEFFPKIYSIAGARAVSDLIRHMRNGRDLYDYDAPEKLSLNRELLESGNRIAVHSEYAKGLVEASGVEAVRLNHPQAGPSEKLRASRAGLGIPEDAVVLGSFGFVAPVKLNHVVCRVVESLQLAGSHPLYYMMVGCGSYVKKHENDHIHVTGFVDNEVFDHYLAATDLVVNLRYPTMGETSGALLRAMAAEKPCVVSNHGWYSEIPDDTVIKLSPEPDLAEQQLLRIATRFLDAPESFAQVGCAAGAHVRLHHSPAVIARRIFDILAGR